MAAASNNWPPMACPRPPEEPRDESEPRTRPPDAPGLGCRPGHRPDSGGRQGHRLVAERLGQPARRPHRLAARRRRLAGQPDRGALRAAAGRREPPLRPRQGRGAGRPRPGGVHRHQRGAGRHPRLRAPAGAAAGRGDRGRRGGDPAVAGDDLRPAAVPAPRGQGHRLHGDPRRLAALRLGPAAQRQHPRRPAARRLGLAARRRAVRHRHRPVHPVERAGHRPRVGLGADGRGAAAGNQRAHAAAGAERARRARRPRPAHAHVRHPLVRPAAPRPAGQPDPAAGPRPLRGGRAGHPRRVPARRGAGARRSAALSLRADKKKGPDGPFKVVSSGVRRRVAACSAQRLVGGAGLGPRPRGSAVARCLIGLCAG
ncbi:hypothetical protein OF001_U80145 [Pseudomonas sp. OF001]|nr:hypothetical protein OF001_U80145 [Pseudomonas sp. OF001]